jgi:hypothetical protein
MCCQGLHKSSVALHDLKRRTSWTLFAAACLPAFCQACHKSTVLFLSQASSMKSEVLVPSCWCWHAGNQGEGQEAQVQEHVALLVFSLADDVSPHTAPLLPDCLSFLINTFDTCLPQVRSCQHTATCARQALAAAFHLTSRQFHTLNKRQPELKAVPAQIAKRLVAFLDVAAREELPLVPAWQMQELLEEFFDMQRLVRAWTFDYMLPASTLPVDAHVPSWFQCSFGMSQARSRVATSVSQSVRQGLLDNCRIIGTLWQLNAAW